MPQSTTPDQAVTVARFERYEDAARVVARLADAHLAEDSTSIVGRDMRLVRVAYAGRGSPRSAAHSAASGALLAGLLALLLVLTDLVTGSDPAVVLWGTAGGALVGLSSHLLTSRRHQVRRVVLRASHFEVIAHPAVAEDVASALYGSPRAA